MECILAPRLIVDANVSRLVITYTWRIFFLLLCNIGLDRLEDLGY